MILIDGMKLPDGCHVCPFRSFGSPPDRDCEGVPQGCKLTDISFFQYYQDNPQWPKERLWFCPLHKVEGKTYMKAFVVTAGDYSNYHIERIFTDREQARLYALQDTDRRVEEYAIDSKNVIAKKQYVLVRYDYRYNKPRDLIMCDKPVKPHIGKASWFDCFEFTVDMDNDRLYKSIVRYGIRSGLLSKIVFDTFAQYLYEHETTKEELIRKLDEEREKERQNYGGLFYTSSFYTRPEIINQDLTCFADEYFKDHGVYPPIDELTK